MRLRQSSLFRWCLLSAHAVVSEPCLSNVLGKQLLLLLWLLLEVLLLLRVLAVLLLHLRLLLPRSCWFHGHRVAFVCVPDRAVHPLE